MWNVEGGNVSLMPRTKNAVEDRKRNGGRLAAAFFTRKSKRVLALVTLNRHPHLVTRISSRNER
jgi:hypothetical protein